MILVMIQPKQRHGFHSISKILFSATPPLFRKQTRVGKARTVSEPSFSDVELRCSHFASPCIARCSQTEPDDIEPSLQSIDDIFAPLPFQMMTTPPADIDLPLWDKPLVDGRSFLTRLSQKTNGLPWHTIKSRFMILITFCWL